MVLVCTPPVSTVEYNIRQAYPNQIIDSIYAGCQFPLLETHGLSFYFRSRVLFEKTKPSFYSYKDS